MNQDDLSDDIIETAKKYCSDYFDVNPHWFNEVVLGMLNLDRAEYQLSSIENDLKIKLERNSKILEIGSGIGSFLLTVSNRGIDCYGIEPNKYGVEASIMRMPHLISRISIGIGESLPYKNNVFNLVVSFQVLEHTIDPKKVLKESIRVLKTGGFLYFVVPNYSSFWEGHYGLYWIPFFPKPLAKLYIRLCGRNPAFLDTIKYINPTNIKRMLANEDIELIDLGYGIWERRFNSLEFPIWGSTKKLLSLAKLIHKLKIAPIIKFICKIFNLYYPIILIARKNGSNSSCEYL